MVDHIDFVYKMDKNGVPYNAAYVHMKSYYSTRFAQEFKTKVYAPTAAADPKLYYNNGLDHFIVLKNNANKHQSFTEGRKRRLVLDEDMPSKNPPTAPATTESPLPLPLELEYLDDLEQVPYFYNVVAPALDGVVRYVMDETVDILEEEYNDYRAARREICNGYY